MSKLKDFDDKLEPFSNYKERLDAFFIANDVSAPKQTATLLSSIGPKTYNLLRSLTAPHLPSSKSYSDLCKILLDHLAPAPLEIVERFKFYRRTQKEGESVSLFLAEIRRLSEFCNFKENLDEALRDKFVVGINDDSIQKRLLQERNLSLNKAVELALAMEQASKDSTSIHLNLNKEEQVSFINKKKAPRNDAHPPCYSCGKSNHKRLDCYFKDAKCRNCSKKGHIQTICNKKKPKNNRNKEVNTFELFNINNVDKTNKFWVYPIVNNTKVKMELDTGCPISIMTMASYKSIFKRAPSIKPVQMKLRTYTGEEIVPLGITTENVTMDKNTRLLTLVIVNKGAHPLLGRDWIRELKINLPHSCHFATVASDEEQLDQILKTHNSVFQDGIGKLNDMKATFQLKDGSKPKFVKARPVPYALKEKVESKLRKLEKEGIIT